MPVKPPALPPLKYYRQDSGPDDKPVNTEIKASEYAKLEGEQRRLTKAGQRPECNALIISQPKPGR